MRKCFRVSTRLAYVFPLSFPHGVMNYFMSLRNFKSNNKISCKSDTGQQPYDRYIVDKCEVFLDTFSSPGQMNYLRLNR